MSLQEFTVELFCRVDDVMLAAQATKAVPVLSKHPQAKLWPSELVTIALLRCLKGGSERAFYAWLLANLAPLFPNLPERTRLFRALATHRSWAELFLAPPTFFGIVDSFGIELIHPRREKRSKGQIGKKGKSNHRWIVGAKLCALVNQFGLIVDWDYDSANVHDSSFRALIEQFQEQCLVFADSGFHSSAKRGGDPANLHLCQRGEHNQRMLVETVFSLLARVLHLKHLGHRAWDYLEARLGFVLATFNILVQWNGLQTDEQGRTALSIAQFTL